MTDFTKSIEEFFENTTNVAKEKGYSLKFEFTVRSYQKGPDARRVQVQLTRTENMQLLHPVQKTYTNEFFHVEMVNGKIQWKDKMFILTTPHVTAGRFIEDYRNALKAQNVVEPPPETARNVVEPLPETTSVRTLKAKPAPKPKQTSVKKDPQPICDGAAPGRKRGRYTDKELDDMSRSDLVRCIRKLEEEVARK